MLFLGRRSQDKGYPIAVKAFLDALKDHPDARLVVIGPPDDYQIQVPSPYQNYVIELGLVEECEKHDALAACDVLCVPSAGESFGMVYMEAWRYKKNRSLQGKSLFWKRSMEIIQVVFLSKIIPKMKRLLNMFPAHFLCCLGTCNSVKSWEKEDSTLPPASHGKT